MKEEKKVLAEFEVPGPVGAIFKKFSIKKFLGKVIKVRYRDSSDVDIVLATRVRVRRPEGIEGLNLKTGMEVYIDSPWQILEVADIAYWFKGEDNPRRS